MMPACDQTGTPAGLEGLRHFISSTASGSAALMMVRTRASISLRQSPLLLAALFVFLAFAVVSAFALVFVFAVRAVIAFTPIAAIVRSDSCASVRRRSPKFRHSSTTDDVHRTTL